MPSDPQTAAPQSEEHYRELVRELEGCTLDSARFHHADHLMVMAVYIHDLGYAAGLDRMRQTIQRYAAHLGASTKYHETLTVFWARMVEQQIRSTTGDLSSQIRAMLSTLGDKTLVDDYFSRELLNSESARQGWVEPDIKPLGPLQQL